MPDDPKASVSQELTGVVDIGKESFSVDTTPPPVEGKPAEDAKEETGEKKEVEEKKEEKPTSEEEKKEDEEVKPKEAAKKEEPKVEPEPEPEDDIKLPKGVEKRLAKMRRKQGDAERRAEAAEAELKVLRAEAKPKIDIGNEPERPDINAFESEDEYDKARDKYLEDLTAFRVKQAIAEQGETQRQADVEAVKKTQEDIQRERQTEIQRGLREGADKYDDFEDAIKDVQIPNFMIEILEKLPNLGDVAYRLGKEPGLLDEISMLSTVDATMRLLELSNSLKPKKTTKAPAPIKPVTTAGGGIKSLEQMSYPEYKKYMQKRERERKGQ